MDGDGETFEEILLRADLIERHIRREQLRNHDVTAAVAMLAHADALIAADFDDRGITGLPPSEPAAAAPPAPAPKPTPKPVSATV